MTYASIASPRTVSAALALALAACGGGGGGSSTSVSVDQLSQSYAHAYCTKAFQCCTTADLAVKFQGLSITDEASCETTYGAFIQLFVTQVKADITAGTVTYDATAGADCLNTLDSLTCAQFAGNDGNLTSGQSCTDPFAGSVADGSACDDDAVCKGGHCDVATSGQPGMCATLPPAGQPCDSFECANGAYCDSTGTTPTCAAVQADGATCTDASQCKSGGCNGAQGSMTCGANTVCDGMS